MKASYLNGTTRHVLDRTFMELGHALSVPEIFLLEPEGPEGGKGGEDLCLFYCHYSLLVDEAKINMWHRRSLLQMVKNKTTCFRITGVNN